MEVYERINEILKERGMHKKEFARRLINLSPILKSTGEVPTVSTIYNYLNGQREIKIELISYIADVLGVFEQELFVENQKDKMKLVEKFIQKLNEEETESMKKLICKDLKNNFSVSQAKIVKLIDFAPKPLMDKILEVLEINKQAVNENMRLLDVSKILE